MGRAAVFTEADEHAGSRVRVTRGIDCCDAIAHLRHTDVQLREDMTATHLPALETDAVAVGDRDRRVVKGVG